MAATNYPTDTKTKLYLTHINVDWTPPSSPAPTDEEMRRTRKARDAYLNEQQHGGFPYCADADKFEKLLKVGQGTFG